MNANQEYALSVAWCNNHNIMMTAYIHGIPLTTVRLYFTKRDNEYFDNNNMSYPWDWDYSVDPIMFAYPKV